MGFLSLVFALALQAPPPPQPGTAVPSPSQPPAPSPAQAPEATPPPPAEPYTYRPEGRRDPFLSLITGGNQVGSTRKTEGPSGMTLAEISVRGILQSRGTLVAMVQGPDNKTYVVHQGDKLQDGTIKAITPQGIVVVQEVNDPLSLVKQREVRKLLRSLEDAKE